jgi:hypothetical protein
MYEWSDLTEIVQELLDIIQKTCAARSDAKLMAIRHKYANKKFGKISMVAQHKVELFAKMQQELDLSSSSISTN